MAAAAIRSWEASVAAVIPGWASTVATVAAATHGEDVVASCQATDVECLGVAVAMVDVAAAAILGEDAVAAAVDGAVAAAVVAMAVAAVVDGVVIAATGVAGINHVRTSPLANFTHLHIKSEFHTKSEFLVDQTHRLNNSEKESDSKQAFDRTYCKL